MESKREMNIGNQKGKIAKAREMLRFAKPELYEEWETYTRPERRRLYLRLYRENKKLLNAA